jgi:hypothetical protein
MVINGRDFTSVAVDSTHPPQRFKGVRPEVLVRNEALALGIGHSLKLTKVKFPPFQSFVTDGSESYWQFWYRLYRKRHMWMWAEPDGTIVASPLNYNQQPSYYFGDHAGLSKKFDKINFIPVETMEWRANKQQRIAVVYVVGARGDKVGFTQKAIDPTMKGWIKRPISIVTSTSAHGPGDARAEAWEEIFESKVGATEITITVANPETVIRQDRTCFLNIAKANVRGEFYVVGTKMVGSVSSGFFQQVRLREKNYAITRRIPSDPQLNNGPGDKSMFGTTGNPGNPAGSIAVGISQTIESVSGNAKNWGSYFVESADKNRGPWPFSLFLGVLLAIAHHETRFRNVRYGGSAGPEYPGTTSGVVPNQVSENAAWNKFVSRYANDPKYGRVAPPSGFNQWAVGPMQLYDAYYKEYADKISGTGINELTGGRWIPRYNIIAGGFAVRSKLHGIEPALDPGNASQAYSLIWQGITGYAGSQQLMYEIKKIYDDSFDDTVVTAVQNASSQNKDKGPIEIPQGNAAELVRQMISNQNIHYRSQVNVDDVKNGTVSLVLLKAMLAFANAGYQGLVWVFKTGHSYLTTSGNVSAHSSGRAVDYGNFHAGDSTHTAAQQWWCNNAVALGVKQVIGPDNNLCYDSRAGFGTAAANWYGSRVLGEHDDHIHIGV